MKKPKDCITIDEIRKEIDSIDKQVVELIGERLQYVKEIVKFKKDKEDVLARERYKQVMKQRRDWAAAEGLDADVIEKMYQSLIAYFIEVQKNALKI